mmetsp:Transcript_46262/g.153362  ORF Transcript_46262/g.153362 Transcript_46262/m.153362 type:complete len:286 (+) Transcript_46262:613-1470(+)
MSARVPCVGGTMARWRAWRRTWRRHCRLSQPTPRACRATPSSSPTLLVTHAAPLPRRATPRLREPSAPICSGGIWRRCGCCTSSGRATAVRSSADGSRRTRRGGNGCRSWPRWAARPSSHALIGSPHSCAISISLRTPRSSPTATSLVRTSSWRTPTWSLMRRSTCSRPSASMRSERGSSPSTAIASQRVRPATPRQRGPKSHRETPPQDSRSPSQQWRQARSARRLRAKRHHEYAGIAALAPPLRRRWREGRGRQRWLAPPQPPQQQQHLKACRPGKATATTQL